MVAQVADEQNLMVAVADRVWLPKLVMVARLVTEIKVVLTPKAGQVVVVVALELPVLADQVAPLQQVMADKAAHMTYQVHGVGTQVEAVEAVTAVNEQAMAMPAVAADLVQHLDILIVHILMK